MSKPKFKHKWVYAGCSPHNGEYWYECSVCGLSDWLPSYTKVTPDWHSDEPCTPKKTVPAPVPCKACNGSGHV